MANALAHEGIFFPVNGTAKSEKGPWCLRTGDWGFFDTSTVQVAGTGIKVTWAVSRKR